MCKFNQWIGYFKYSVDIIIFDAEILLIQIYK